MKLRIRFSDGWEIRAEGVRRRILCDQELGDAQGPVLLARSFFSEPGEGTWSGWPGVLAWEPEDWRAGREPERATRPPVARDWTLTERKPDRTGWDRFCGSIMEGISSGRIQKVVAARSETYRCRDFPRIEELEERLFSLSDGVHRFFLETPWGVFLGASPEYLFHRQGDRVIVPAIAGSAAPEKAHSLLRGSKERLEHDLVIREIEQSLRGLGLNPKRGETSVLPLQHLHHLFTPVEARTAGGAARALLRALHPTPALGGYPRRAASEFLRKEPLQRGFFGAPLGFWSKEEDRMLVAIRCALVRGGTATLFAGAGVVNGSSAEAEWRETHRKMSAMRAILGIPEVGGEG